MEKKLLSMLLVVILIIGILPISALATITHDGDFPVSQTQETNPTSMVSLMRVTLADARINGPWREIYQQIVNELGKRTNHTEVAAPTQTHYTGSLTYASSLRAAVQTVQSDYLDSLNDITDRKDHRDDYYGLLNNLSDKKQDVLYAYNYAGGYESGNYHSRVYAFQLFYDFEIEPAKDKFKSEEVNVGDDLETLLKKGITYYSNASSGSNSNIIVTNHSAEETTVSKGFEYTQSETITTETSHSYNAHLGGSSSLAVKIGFKIPVFGGADSDVTVTQSVDYSRDITDTYTSGTQKETSMSNNDSISLMLPPHTTSEIQLSNYDAVTSIPYSGGSTIRYKTKIIYFGAEAGREMGDWDLRTWITPVVVTFGDETKVFSAIEDLDDRIRESMNGYDRDGLDDLMKKSAFKTSANKLLSGQPYTQYSGRLKHAIKTTTITPGAIAPLHPAKEFLTDTEKITMYSDQTVPTKSISVAANNERGVSYYGFNQRQHGTWAIVDASGTPNSEYAQLQPDINGYAEIVAKKATDGAKIYLTFVPTKSKFISLDDDYISEKILIEIKSYPVSLLRIDGDFGSYILNDVINTANVSDIDVHAKTGDNQSWQEITGSSKIKWYVEEPSGIIVTTSGDISFSKVGTYQIYAAADGQESNRLVLTVTRPRELEKLEISGEIGTLLWDGSPKTFDLSGLTVSGIDNYGDPFTVDPSSITWMSTNMAVASVSDSTLTALAAGQGSVTASVGKIYSDDFIPFTVKDAPRLDTITVTGDLPELCYDDPAHSSYDLTQLMITALDQYGNSFTLDPNQYVWTLGKGEAIAKVENNILNGLVVGEDSLTLSYPVGDGYIEADRVLAVKVNALPYVNELYYNGGAPICREGIDYDLSQIPLLAKDQFGKEIASPAFHELTWSLSADNSVSGATISGGMLTVPQGTVADASELTVTLEASFGGQTARNVFITVRQLPRLTNLTVSALKEFNLRIGENGSLSDYFTVVGYDQYLEVIPVTAPPLTWYSSEPSAIELQNGKLKVLQEDEESEIYATVEDIVSNKIALSVKGARRLSSVAVAGTPRAVPTNTQLSLSSLTIVTFDQYTDDFSDAELAAYPADIRWSLEQNDGTNASIAGGTLSFGNNPGVLTLICAVVNSDTSNEGVEKRLQILVGGGIVDAVTPNKATMTSAAGGNEITLAGENLSDGITIAAFNSAGDIVSGVTAATTGTASEQKAALSFPANSSTTDAVVYTIKYSFDGGDFEKTPSCTVTIDKASGSGLIGSGPGPGGNTDIDDDETPKGDAITHNAYISGYQDGTFQPDRNITRAEAASMLYKLMEDTSKHGEGFSDVKSGDWYYEAVMALSGAGIINGYSDSTFRPNSPVTRAEFVAMIVRFAKVTGTGSVTFSDVPSTHWAYNLIVTAVGEGYVMGYPNGTFVPEGYITRAEAVTIINRMLECDYNGSGKFFSDIPATHWAYHAITAASTDHEHTH